MQPLDFNLTKAAYSINEILEILPLGRTSLYEAINTGQLRATKFGKKTMILAPDMAAFLDSLHVKQIKESLS